MTHTRYNTLYEVSKDKKEEMANEIADIIIVEYEENLVNHFIKTEYPFLEEYEQNAIKKYAMEERKENYAERREMVRRAVLEFLSDNNCIVPRGFVDFRMREIYACAKKFVFNGAERFFNEQEYEEFIYLLSMFINERQCKEKIIHVIWEEGNVRLLNKFWCDVTEKYEREFMEAAISTDAKSEDLAVSAIISAAPERVVLHMPPENSALASTLEKLFKGNSHICNGCDICKKS